MWLLRLKVQAAENASQIFATNGRYDKSFNHIDRLNFKTSPIHLEHFARHCKAAEIGASLSTYQACLALTCQTFLTRNVRDIVVRNIVRSFEHSVLQVPREVSSKSIAEGAPCELVSSVRSATVQTCLG